MKSIYVVIIVVVVGGIGFFAGMQYKSSQQTQNRATFANQFQGRGRFGRNSMRPVVGEIISQDDKSITVKMTDGSSKIVILSETTTYNKAAQASKSNLKVGERVGVFGTQNSDGSVTAQNIQLNPAVRGNITGTPR